jgi:hypothetical protein
VAAWWKESEIFKKVGCFKEIRSYFFSLIIVLPMEKMPFAGAISLFSWILI